MTDELSVFRESFRRFLTAELAPRAEDWRAQKRVDREAWRALGDMGALCPEAPREYGGVSGTFAHVAAVIEDLEQALPEMAIGVTVHNAIVSQYVLAYGSREQKQRWLPGLVKGQLIGAIAMTEPSAGSDLQNLRTQARRKGDSYELNGQKTFITNGQIADLIIVAAKTEPQQGVRGISLLMVETDETKGFGRGRSLDKIGLPASDTSELFFDNAVVPRDNLLGTEGHGFMQMMEQLPKERLGLAIQAVAATERAIEITVSYTKERKVFGNPIIEFQNTAFKLAERRSEAFIGRVFIDWCIERVIAGELDQVTAAMAKWWTTAKQVETADECLQLHGGYGYMREFEIARRFVDARVQEIYGGTNEIMKLLIAQSL
jgi:acyl-CoA dehydrogenase